MPFVFSVKPVGTISGMSCGEDRSSVFQTDSDDFCIQSCSEFELVTYCRCDKPCGGHLSSRTIHCSVLIDPIYADSKHRRIRRAVHSHSVLSHVPIVCDDAIYRGRRSRKNGRMSRTSIGRSVSVLMIVHRKSTIYKTCKPSI